MIKYLRMSAVAVSTLSTAAIAKPVDNYVATLIQNADYGAAEGALTARIARGQTDQNALLNLAFVYRNTDRWTEASALYSRVLAGPDAQVNTAGGQKMSAHDIARAALGTGMTFASR